MTVFEKSIDRERLSETGVFIHEDAPFVYGVNDLFTGTS